jgi:hypothetical protein
VLHFKGIYLLIFAPDYLILGTSNTMFALK